MVMRAHVFFFTAATFFCLCRAFYFPGVAVKDFKDGEPVKLKVNKLTSVYTHLPYDYYDLPFCKVVFEIIEVLCVVQIIL